jgi:hypothetical protein
MAPGKSSDTEDDDPRSRRSADFDVPDWWTDLAYTWCRTLADLRSDEAIGMELARVAGRSVPWSKVTIGRFFRKDAQRITSREIADALQKLLPRLPPYVVIPGDFQEAMALDVVHAAAERRRAVEGTAPHHAADESGAHTIDEGATIDFARRKAALDFEKAYLERVLTHAHGSISAAARIAGLDRTQLRLLLQRHGIDSTKYKG